jgi:hypothetical protein
MRSMSWFSPGLVLVLAVGLGGCSLDLTLPEAPWDSGPRDSAPSDVALDSLPPADGAAKDAKQPPPDAVKPDRTVPDSKPSDLGVEVGPPGDTLPTADTLKDSKTPSTVTITNALSGPTGTTTGYAVELSTEFWPGWRFEVPAGNTFTVSKVGLHIYAKSVDLSIFGSLVALTGPSDQPDKLDLSGSDVIKTTVFNMAPVTSGSQNVSGTLKATLKPGWYAVIFGAGKSGTNGNGLAFNTNTKLTGVQNIFLITQSTQAVTPSTWASRLFVEGTMQP